MPRWKALPEELDPQLREFAGQLRRLVDRSGLSLAAVADRTGYSKTSWERYLNGRLLAPKGAVVALAEATGAQQHHLTTMWELAERAWSRSEMRHDMTMEAIRISQARAALGEAGVAAAPPAGRRAGGADGAVSTTAGLRGGGAVRPPAVPVQRGSLARVPRQPGPGAVPDSEGRGEGGARAGRAPEGETGGRRRVTMFLAGAVGAFLLMAAAVLLTDFGGGGDAVDAVAATTPSGRQSSGSASQRPAGVGCEGADCTGQDPEAMGCGGRSADTVARATVDGGLLEVRYSETCGAAWARITRASTGDTVRITAGPAEEKGTVDADADAYTPMVAVAEASDAKACATLASGTTGCAVAE
ncbi:DUF2690 domain-containing protein [Streptomyces sp. NPDC001741]|uniref:helix-turn-helix domain-containing protein n=1 Tax=unclassified Streptomyces TaxID=2593676 RepID=UPI003680D4CC